MTPLFILSVLVASAVIVEVVIRLRLRFGSSGLDTPGNRSLHTRPTPHGGGLGIVAAVLCTGLVTGVSPSLLAAVLLLALISMLDDWRPLPFWSRLIAHLLAAGSVVFLHGEIGWPVLIVTTVLIAWATNAYNFMDGADGLAGSMTAIGFAAYAAGFWLGGESRLALLSLAIVVSSLVFLRFNWHPARIFMGDVGSVPVGFLAGALGWYGVVRGIWPVWFPFVVFSPFFCDATITLLQRALRGERVWQAHREHYYQRMVRMGVGHDRMCRRWAVAMLAAGFVALAGRALPEPGGWLLACGWLVALGVMGRRLDTHWSEHVGTS